MPITQSAAPPRKGTANRSSVAQQSQIQTTPTLSQKARERKEGLEGWAQIGGVVLIARGQFADAGALSIHAPAVITEVARLGDTHEPIARILDFFTMSGPYAALVGACVPLIAQIAVNHKLMSAIPGMDILPPEALEAKVKAELAEMAAKAIQMQRDAERKLAELQE